jgi:hypothetical protein
LTARPNGAKQPAVQYSLPLNGVDCVQGVDEDMRRVASAHAALGGLRHILAGDRRPGRDSSSVRYVAGCSTRSRVNAHRNAHVAPG